MNQLLQFRESPKDYRESSNNNNLKINPLLDVKYFKWKRTLLITLFIVISLHLKSLPLWCIIFIHFSGISWRIFKLDKQSRKIISKIVWRAQNVWTDFNVFLPNNLDVNFILFYFKHVNAYCIYLLFFFINKTKEKSFVFIIYNCKHSDVSIDNKSNGDFIFLNKKWFHSALMKLFHCVFQGD